MRTFSLRLDLGGILVAFLFLVHCTAGGQSFGPYTVTRVLPFPPGGIGDLEFANGFLYSVEDYNGNIHELDPFTGQTVASWSVPGFALHNGFPDDMPTGLAWDGARMWMATRVPNVLRKLDLGSPPTVTVEAAYSMPGWPQDLTYANGYLYYPEYLGPIRKVDPHTGMVVGSIPSPTPFSYAMTFDGQNLLVGMGLQGDDTLWVVSPEDGSIVDTWHTGVDGMLGLAYDPATQSLYMGRLFDITVAQIPEPGTLAMFTLGLAGLAVKLKQMRSLR